MASIILTKGCEVLRDVKLIKERLMIGRGPHNDIVLEDRAISAEHAMIVTRGGDSFLEDLNSTNGTQVNGQPVRLHFLQDGDVIELAQYRICYVVNDAGSAADASGPMMPRFRVLDGPNAGRETVLSKTLTTLGKHGEQVAILSNRQGAFFLTHVEGSSYPLVNGQPIGTESCELRHQDIILLGETRVQFLMR